MLTLCIDQQSSELFAGANEPLMQFPRDVHFARCVQIPDGTDPATAIPAQYSMQPEHFGFLEESFDPVSRVRRGRLWSPIQEAQPSRRELGPSTETRLAWHVPSALVKRAVYTFQPALGLVRQLNRGVGALLAIGEQPAYTLWRVLNVEISHDQALMVTLKSRTALGALPDLNLSSIDPAHHDALRENYRIVLDAVHRESPGSIVDRCKDTMAVMISRWLVQKGQDCSAMHQDIGKLVNRLTLLEQRPFCVEHLGGLLAKLHARNKPNVQVELGARPVNESDAELAVQALSFVMHDIGLAVACT